MNMNKNVEFVSPYKRVSLKERQYTPPFDVIMCSPLMHNSFVFMFDGMTVCYWPELCIMTVDKGIYHYFCFILSVDIDNCEYEAEWYLRNFYKNLLITSAPIDERVLAYVFGYCNVQSYKFKNKTRVYV